MVLQGSQGVGHSPGWWDVGAEEPCGNWQMCKVGAYDLDGDGKVDQLVLWQTERPFVGPRAKGYEHYLGKDLRQTTFKWHPLSREGAVFLRGRADMAVGGGIEAFTPPPKPTLADGLANGLSTAIVFAGLTAMTAVGGPELPPLVASAVGAQSLPSFGGQVLQVAMGEATPEEVGEVVGTLVAGGAVCKALIGSASARDPAVAFKRARAMEGGGAVRVSVGRMLEWVDGVLERSRAWAKGVGARVSAAVEEAKAAAGPAEAGFLNLDPLVGARSAVEKFTRWMRAGETSEAVESCVDGLRDLARLRRAFLEDPTLLRNVQFREAYDTVFNTLKKSFPRLGPRERSLFVRRILELYADADIHVRDYAEMALDQIILDFLPPKEKLAVALKLVEMLRDPHEAEQRGIGSPGALSEIHGRDEVQSFLFGKVIPSLESGDLLAFADHLVKSFSGQDDGLYYGGKIISLLERVLPRLEAGQRPAVVSTIANYVKVIEPFVCQAALEGVEKSLPYLENLSPSQRMGLARSLMEVIEDYLENTYGNGEIVNGRWGGDWMQGAYQAGSLLNKMMPFLEEADQSAVGALLLEFSQKDIQFRDRLQGVAGSRR